MSLSDLLYIAKKGIKELFGINSNITSTEFTKYSALIEIPKKKVFKHNKDIIKRINEYKQKYWEILSTESTIISKNLCFSNFYDELRMNMDLLINIVFKHTDFNNDNYLKKELNNLKLNLYEQRINEMELETIIKGIALREVYHEKLLFLKKDKINAINEELNSLRMQLNYFYYQKEAIRREKETYLCEIETNELKAKNINDDIEQEAKERLEYLSIQLNEIMPDIVKEINLRKESYLSKLAYLERILETYVYKNKELLEKIDSRLEYYLRSKYYLNFQGILKEDKEKFLNEIKELEIICNIFNEYGRNLSIDNVLRKLYTFKFDILTINIFERDFSSFISFELQSKENEIYQEIIMQKINQLLNAQNLITQDLFGEDLKKALKIIIKYLKEDNENPNIYEPDKILDDIDKLCLLLSFEKESGLQEFYNTRKTDFTYYANRTSINFHRNMFSWEDYVSLESIFRWQILDSTKESKKRQSLLEKELSEKTKSPYIRDLDSLFDLYSYFIKHKEIEKNVYYLPEGLTEISMKTNISFEIYENSPLGKELLNAINDNLTIITPKSLKKWIGELLPKDSEIQSIVLNENLEKIRSLDLLRIKELTIPPNLEPIDWNYIIWRKLKTITFLDFRHNRNLNNTNVVEDIVSDAYYKETITKCLIDKCTNLEKIVLVDEDGTRIEINASELFPDDITELIPKNNNISEMTSDDYDEIVFSNFQKVIYEKTGHILFEKAKKQDEKSKRL